MLSRISKKRFLATALTASLAWVLVSGAPTAFASEHDDGHSRGKSGHMPGHAKRLVSPETPTVLAVPKTPTVVIISRTQHPALVRGLVIPSANTPALSKPALGPPASSGQSGATTTPKPSEIQPAAPAISNVDASLAGNSRPASHSSKALWIGLAVFLTAVLCALGAFLIVRGTRVVEQGEHVRKREFQFLATCMKRARTYVVRVKSFVISHRPNLGRSVVVDSEVLVLDGSLSGARNLCRKCRLPVIWSEGEHTEFVGLVAHVGPQFRSYCTRCSTEWISAISTIANDADVAGSSSSTRPASVRIAGRDRRAGLSLHLDHLGR